MNETFTHLNGNFLLQSVKGLSSSVMMVSKRAAAEVIPSAINKSKPVSTHKQFESSAS